MSSSTPSPLSDGTSSEGSPLRAFVDETLEQDRQGAPMSPRSALLSQTPLQPPSGRHPSASVASDRRSSAHGAVEKRRDTRSRNSRDRRKRATTTAGTAGSPDFSVTRLSKLELDRLRNDPHAEAVELRRLLEAAVRQVHLESKRAADLERANQETAMRFRMLNDNRVAAQQEAVKASSEVKLYQAQLDNAHKDLDRTRQALQEVERQRDDAEAAATRAREKARRLHQERLIAAAKEEGRRLGYQAGFDHAKKEREILASRKPPLLIGGPPSNAKGKEREKYSEDGSPRHRSHGRRPPDDDIESTPSLELSPSQLPIRGLPLDPPEEANTSNATTFRDFQPPPGTDEVGSQRQTTPPPQQVPSSSSRPYHLLQTPSVQVWPLEIPAPDQVDQSYNSHENPNDPVPPRPRNEWVTANKHQQIRSNRPSKLSHSTMRTQASGTKPGGPPPPRPIFPVEPPPPEVPQTGPIPNSSRPPLGGPSKSVRFPTWARRPSLAKTKAQATSWYRRLSFRKKTKPVIDPILEESETPQSSATIPLSATVPQTAPTEPPDSGRSAENVYGATPQALASWYQTKRASVASTRVSQFDLLATPALGGLGPSQSSNRARQQVIKEKESFLSAINEDRSIRGQTPDRYSNAVSSAPVPGPSGRVSMASMRQPVPAAPQTVQHQSSFETDNRSRRSRRPKSIVVPDPNAPLLAPSISYLQQSLGVGGYGSNPNLAHKPSIEIDVVPPSAYAPNHAQSPPHTGRHHLSPYHVFKPGPSMPTFQGFSDPPIDPPAPPTRPDSAAASRRSNHSRSASAGIYGNPMSASTSSPLHPPRPLFAYGTSGSASGRPESVRSGQSRRPVPRNASQSSFRLHNPDPPSESSSPDPYPPPQPRVQDIVAPTEGSAGIVLAPPMHRHKSSTSMKSQGSYMRYDPQDYNDPAYWGVDGPGGPPAATPGRPKPGMLVDEDHPRPSRRASANSALSYA